MKFSIGRLILITTWVAVIMRIATWNVKQVRSCIWGIIGLTTEQAWKLTDTIFIVPIVFYLFILSIVLMAGILTALYYSLVFWDYTKLKKS